MRHKKLGRRFGRHVGHRQAMFSNMAAALIKHEQIITTLPKAKDLKRVVDKYITLAKRGDHVYATDVNFAALEKVRDELGWREDQIRIAALDVRDAAAWESTFDDAVSAYGRIHVCMNIAGVLLAAWTDTTPLKEIDLQIDVNVKGLIFGTRVAAQHMVAQGGGHIVNISSVAGRQVNPNAGVYAATKFGVGAFSEAVRREVYKNGIRVTIIEPGVVDTELREHITVPAVKDAINAWADSMRQLQAEDIAAAIIYAVTQPSHVNVNEILEAVMNFPHQ